MKETDKRDLKKDPLSRESIEYCIVSSLLGLVLVARSKIGLCAVLIGDNKRELQSDLERRFSKLTVVENNSKKIKGLAGKVLALLTVPHRKFDLPLDMRGTPFQQSVWTALRQVPSGRTMSYADIALKLKRPTAVRAVARACASNPVALVVPCHRIVKSDGGISGYRWGVERKKYLLQLESR